MTKIIGCPGWILDGKYFGVTLPYIEFISKFGQLRIITPQDSYNPPELDLLIMPGGADINPLTYSSTPSFRTNAPNLMLEYFDSEILSHYLDNNTPIFAICRGAQRLYTMFGGHLIQHYPYHKQSTHSKDECHGLEFTNDYKKFNRRVDKVTSRHHQVMSGERETPEELDIIAFSKTKEGNTEYVDKSVVEIFRHKSKPIYGVQYHPEDNSTEFLSSDIINKLLGE